MKFQWIIALWERYYYALLALAVLLIQLIVLRCFFYNTKRVVMKNQRERFASKFQYSTCRRTPHTLILIKSNNKLVQGTVHLLSSTLTIISKKLILKCQKVSVDILYSIPDRVTNKHRIHTMGLPRCQIHKCEW